jgi:hypothetical protein
MTDPQSVMHEYLARSRGEEIARASRRPGALAERELAATRRRGLRRQLLPVSRRG